MALHGAACRARLGSLVGGDEGRDLEAAARAYFVAEGVTRPERMVALVAPGFEPVG
jgi:hypothetical protein